MKALILLYPQCGEVEYVLFELSRLHPGEGARGKQNIAIFLDTADMKMDAAEADVVCQVNVGAFIAV
jgi:hypothetical protein